MDRTEESEIYFAEGTPRRQIWPSRIVPLDGTDK